MFDIGRKTNDGRQALLKFLEKMDILATPEISKFGPKSKQI